MATPFHPRRVPNFTVGSITRERNAQNEKLTDCVMESDFQVGFVNAARKGAHQASDT